MSRTTFSASRPRRGGTYRPQLEVLEGRLAPGALAGALQPPPIDPAGIAAQRDREAAQLAFLAGLQAGPRPGPTPAPAPDLREPLQGAGAGGGGGGSQADSRGGSQRPVVTTNPVVDFATRTIVFGESTVMRRENGITAHLHASGLEPGVYTFWMGVAVPGVPGSPAGRLAGHVVGESGIANFSGHVREGDIVGNPSIPGREGTLQDPLHATVTLVVRSHGPAEPGRIHEQTHSFEPDRAFNFLISIHVPPP